VAVEIQGLRRDLALHDQKVDFLAGSLKEGQERMAKAVEVIELSGSRIATAIETLTERTNGGKGGGINIKLDTATAIKLLAAIVLVAIAMGGGQQITAKLLSQVLK